MLLNINANVATQNIMIIFISCYIILSLFFGGGGFSTAVPMQIHKCFTFILSEIYKKCGWNRNDYSTYKLVVRIYTCIKKYNNCHRHKLWPSLHANSSIDRSSINIITTSVLIPMISWLIPLESNCSFTFANNRHYSLPVVSYIEPISSYL